MILNRRALLAGLGLAGLSLGATGIAQATTDALTIVTPRLHFPNLPAQFDGYRIGFLSDLHLGPCVDMTLGRMAVQRMNDAQPDLILLGGDYILRADSSVERFGYWVGTGKNCAAPKASYREEQAETALYFQEIASLLSALRAKDGVVGVLGNHDYWVSPKACHKYLPEAGVRLLTNEIFSIVRERATLSIFGADDYWSGIPVPPKFPDMQPQFKVLLTHNPDFVSEALRRDNAFDLALAGHTHGGQLCFPVLGPLSYNVEDTRFASGLVHLNESYCYTTRGIGTVGIPMRINCPPEVTVIELLRTTAPTA